MNGLNIAFITSEAVPYSKTGGLADVSGVLPGHIARAGHKVRVFLPLYRKTRLEFPALEKLEITAEVSVGTKSFTSELFFNKNDENGTEFYYIANDLFFDRDELYCDPSNGDDYKDNDDRFIFFCRSVLEVLKLIGDPPDILHANDWQAALTVSLLKTAYKYDPFFVRTKTILSLHNLAYQGLFPEETFNKLGLDKSYFAPGQPFEYWEKVSFLKAAVLYADKITTVSPTYASEIQNSNEYGMGLEGILKDRSEDLVGILNGVDYDIWSPKTDKLIPFRYNPSNLSGKKKNKLELLNYAGLPLRTEQPLIGMISRLDSQKGFDILSEILEDVLKLDLQFVLLGTGAEEYHRLFEKSEISHPDKLKAFLTFDNSLAHLIEAGADIFLMPSRYEPCGLNQMYSLKYGTVPIVRKTGGLADTITSFDQSTGEGDGFVFDEYDSEVLYNAIKNAVTLFGKKRIWYKIVKQGMSRDYSWDKSAKKYIDLYTQMIHLKPDEAETLQQ